VKHLLLTAILLLSFSAQADMFQDAGNAKLPEAINNLTAAGAPAVGGPITLTAGGSINLSASTADLPFTHSPGAMGGLVGNGFSVNTWWGAKPPTQTQFMFGTGSAPITEGGSPVAIGIIQNIPKENCLNQSAATGCNSALLLQNMGGPGSTMVSSALTAYAETQSLSGGGLGNAQGINAIGVGSVTSTAHGMGAYINGVRLGTLGGLRGMELRGTNASSADCAAAAHDLSSECIVLHIGMAGPAGGPRRLVSSVIQVSGISSLYGGAREGLIFGNNSVDEITIADRTSSANSILIDGAHTYGLASSPNSGKYGFGTLTPTARVHVGGLSGPGVFNVFGAGLEVDGTYNDTTSGGTVANAYLNVISPTLTANNATTLTQAITLRLAAPTAGTNVTATRTFALHVAGTIASRGTSMPATNIGTGISQISGIWTDTTSNGTVAINSVNSLGAATMAATNPTNYTTATNLLVVAPVAGSNVTIGTSWAAQFQGNVQMTAAVNLTGLPTSAGAGGLAVCVDTAGVLYRKAACP
jgi:hypothetical protein